jgi:seryl-tRNA synthetase
MEKEESIAVSKTKQFCYENLTWERLLEFFKQENAFLKTRLSEVVDQLTDKDFLELAEHFQNVFIIKDEFIDELRHDINDHEILLKRVLGSADKKADKKILKKQEKLRNEMETLERDFTKDKNQFNKYLASVL